MCENAFMKVWVASTGSIFKGEGGCFLHFYPFLPQVRPVQELWEYCFFYFVAARQSGLLATVRCQWKMTHRDKYGFSFIEAFQTMVREKEFKKITSEL